MLSIFKNFGQAFKNDSIPSFGARRKTGAVASNNIARLSRVSRMQSGEQNARVTVNRFSNPRGSVAGTRPGFPGKQHPARPIPNLGDTKFQPLQFTNAGPSSVSRDHGYRLNSLEEKLAKLNASMKVQAFKDSGKPLSSINTQQLNRQEKDAFRQYAVDHFRSKVIQARGVIEALQGEIQSGKIKPSDVPRVATATINAVNATLSSYYGEAKAFIRATGNGVPEKSNSALLGHLNNSQASAARTHSFDTVLRLMNLAVKKI